MGNSKSLPATVTERSVIVVGGGYAGVSISQKLEALGFDVTLIDKKDYFLHAVGTLRAVYLEGWEQKVAIPYTAALTRGKVIQGQLHSVFPNDNKIQLDDKQELSYNFLVIATGNARPPSFPAQAPDAGLHRDNYLEAVAAYRKAVAESKRILIVGGGPVGVELAAEAADGYKDKEITLVHSGSTLLSNSVPELSAQMTAATLQKLTSRGVKVILEEKAQINWDQEAGTTGKSYLQGERIVVTSKGKEITADIVINCIGANNFGIKGSPTSYYPKDWVNEASKVKVNEQLQVTAVPAGNVFAVGDVTDLAETKLAFYVEKHAAVASENIFALGSGTAKDKLPSTYKPEGKSAMALALGKGDALLEMGGQFRGGIGSFIITQAKSKTLLVEKQWKILKLPVPS